MKKYLLILLLFIAVPAYSQILYLQTTAFSSNVYQYGRWSGWCAWENSCVNVTLDINNGSCIIYSPATQVYRFTDSTSFYDNDGDFNTWFKFIDQDGDIGTLKFIKREDSGVELYVQFNNVMWVYRVVLIREVN